MSNDGPSETIDPVVEKGMKEWKGKERKGKEGKMNSLRDNLNPRHGHVWRDSVDASPYPDRLCACFGDREAREAQLEAEGDGGQLDVRGGASFEDEVVGDEEVVAHLGVVVVVWVSWVGRFVFG
jgi:hypothetical protein